MRALDRLSEGDGDEPQPETPGASGAPGCEGKAAAAGFPGDPLRVNVRRRRRRCDAGTPEMLARMERARAAQDPDASRKHPWRRGLSKIEALLTPEHRLQFDELLRDQFKTLADAKRWLDERGYHKIGMAAIVNHRHHFDDTLVELREVSRFAGNVRHLFGKHGPTVMGDVSLTRMQQVLTERLFRRGATGGGGNAVDLEIEQLAQLSKMVDSAIGARLRLEQIRQDFESVRKLVAPEGEQAAEPGTDGELVVNRVKQLLGVPLGPETPEEAAAADRQYVPFDLAELEKPSPKRDSEAKT